LGEFFKLPPYTLAVRGPYHALLPKASESAKFRLNRSVFWWARFAKIFFKTKTKEPAPVHPNHPQPKLIAKQVKIDFGRKKLIFFYCQWL
jgi:hypothetical protein